MTHTPNQWRMCHMALTGHAHGDGWRIYEASFRALYQGLQASSSPMERGMGGSRDDRGKNGRIEEGWIGGGRDETAEQRDLGIERQSEVGNERNTATCLEGRSKSAWRVGVLPRKGDVSHKHTRMHIHTHRVGLF